MKSFWVLLLIFPLLISAQLPCKSAPVQVFTVKAKEGEKKLIRTKGRIMVNIIGDFDDSTLLLVNDILIFSRFMKTDPLAGPHYSVSLSKKSANGKSSLKMLLWNKKICSEAHIVSFKYPVLEIRYHDDKWLFTYTDRVAQIE